MCIALWYVLVSFIIVSWYLHVTVFVILTEILPPKSKFLYHLCLENECLWYGKLLLKTYFCTFNICLQWPSLSKVTPEFCCLFVFLQILFVLCERWRATALFLSFYAWGQYLCRLRPQSASSFLFFFIYKVDIKNCCVYNSTVAINVPFLIRHLSCVFVCLIFCLQ